jgi:hypothetical protein
MQKCMVATQKSGGRTKMYSSYIDTHYLSAHPVGLLTSPAGLAAYTTNSSVDPISSDLYSAPTYPSAGRADLLASPSASPASSTPHLADLIAHLASQPAGLSPMFRPEDLARLMPRQKDLIARLLDVNAGITSWGRIIGCRRQDGSGYMLLKGGSENFPLYTFKKGSDIAGGLFVKNYYKPTIENSQPNKGVLNCDLSAKQSTQLEITDPFDHIFAIVQVERDRYTPRSKPYSKHSITAVGCKYASGTTR